MFSRRFVMTILSNHAFHAFRPIRVSTLAGNSLFDGDIIVGYFSKFNSPEERFSHPRDATEVWHVYLSD
jgi:hypothetical protein